MRVFLQGKKDGHLAEDHGQYAAIYTHMEHLAATSPNADIAGRAKKIHKQLKDLVFTAFCHFVSDLFGELALLSLKLQKNNLILPLAVAAIKDCIETIGSMKEECIPGGMYEKFLKCIEEQQFQNLQPRFQGIEMTGSPICLAKDKLNKYIESTVDLIIKELESRFQNLLGANTSVDAQGVVQSFLKVFNNDTWPESKRELLHFGNHEIDVICDWFRKPLVAAGCNMELVKTEWRQLKFFVANTFRDKSYSDLWQILLTKDPYKTDFYNVLHLVRIMLILPISSAECERAFSAQKRIKSVVRSSLSVQKLSDLVMISFEGPDLAEFNPEKSIEKWMANGRRKIAGGPGQCDWPPNIVCESKK